MKAQVESDNAKSIGHTRVQWAVTLLVNTALMTYGLQCGWISPMSKILQSEESPAGRPLTDSEISLIAGVPSVSSIFAILVSVNLVDKYGRRKAILVIALSQLISWIITICPANFYSLVLARIFCGFGAGGCFHIIPMYIKEISQSEIRGTLGSMPIFTQNIGIVAMYALGGYLDYYTVLYLVVGLPVLTMATFYVAPESPSFLIKQEKQKEAITAIAFLRGLDINDKEVHAEIDLIQREHDYFQSMPKISFVTIFKHRAWRRGLFIMVVIMILHGMNGTFSILNFASTLLANSEITISPEMQSLGIPVFLTLGTLITVGIIDRAGRKLLLGSTFGVSMISCAALASVMLLRNYGWATPEWLPVTMILATACAYGAGVSPVPYVLMTEMFNFQIRAKVMACLCILAWATTFIQLICFTAITSTLGVHMSFYMFSVINLIGVVIVIVFLPETRQKTVDQIEAKLIGPKNVVVKINC